MMVQHALPFIGNFPFTQSDNILHSYAIQQIIDPCVSAESFIASPQFKSLVDEVISGLRSEMFTRAIEQVNGVHSMDLGDACDSYLTNEQPDFISVGSVFCDRRFYKFYVALKSYYYGWYPEWTGNTLPNAMVLKREQDMDNAINTLLKNYKSLLIGRWYELVKSKASLIELIYCQFLMILIDELTNVSNVVISYGGYQAIAFPKSNSIYHD